MAKAKGIDTLVLPPFRGLPTPVKYGVIVAEGWLLYRGYKIAKKLIDPPQSEETVDSAVTEAEQILKNNAKLPPGSQTLASFTPSQMKIFADTLDTAMRGAGTDEQAVLSVFAKMQNDLDILLLIDAFGVRKSGYFGSEENLVQWLNGDGMTADVNKLLDTKAKITKRF